ncbi:rhodanese-like domain-containing protein [Helicobacter cholecystus]|uniref:Rhodanese-like domain-containing protein n=1 Tax=Helicobacter cholecystus TaxID=45498 RepID=A0A3D8ISQ6_9HELI|nr:rhodanese-like domain-containing protein [Helicobacter cholecystus]RDU68232.1 rhodanese-like domain-containing protein [Helicobacter cholecystus]VEJ24470.1 rhodanese-like domain-containing protein [Helicobacter cholecystus]
MGKDILKKILKQQNHPSLALKVDLENLKIEEYIVVDVRTPSLYITTPHIQNSYNIHNLSMLQDFCQQHQNQKILLVCNGGLESAKYGTLLVENGLKNIFYLDEYLQIIEEKIPLEYPKEAK